MRENIALIGFMGTGKTSIGRLLAVKSGKKFVETDRIIEENAGKRIPDIFENDGEIKFRELEIEAVKKAALMRNAVISCGGGVVLNQINIQRLKKNSFIVLLTASPEAIVKRIGDGDRPLLKGRGKPEKIKKLLASRKPFYGVSDFTVDTSRISAEKAAEKIIGMLNGRQD